MAGNDVDYSGIDIVQEPATEGNLTDFKQFSEELRLAGKSGPLDWLVGGFFSSEILTSNTAIYAGNDFDLYVGGVASASVGANPPNFLLIPGFTGNPPGGTFIPGVSGEQDFYHDTSKSYAFFTNETYNISPGFGFDRRSALHVGEENRGFELCRSGWRLRLRATATSPGVNC